MRARTSRSGATSPALDLGPGAFGENLTTGGRRRLAARGSASAGGSARSSCASPARASPASSSRRRSACAASRSSSCTPAARARISRSPRRASCRRATRSRSSTGRTTTSRRALVIEAMLLDRTRVGEVEPARPDMLPEAAGVVRGAGGVSLDRLVGTWRTEARFPNGVSGTGTTTFELVLGGEYLLQRATVEVDGPPEGLMVIGPDEHGAPTQHYFDSRGVTRRYAMTLEGDTWTLERDGVQRYAGASRTTTPSAAPGSGSATAPGSTTSSWTTGAASRRSGAASARGRASPGRAPRAAPRSAASGRAPRGGRPRARRRSRARPAGPAAAAS